MSIENIIRDKGQDIEIMRNGKRITKTKAMYNSKDRTFGFTYDTDVRMGDMLQVIDTTQTYMVTEIIIAPGKNHKTARAHLS